MVKLLIYLLLADFCLLVRMRFFGDPSQTQNNSPDRINSPNKVQQDNSSDKKDNVTNKITRGMMLR